MSHVFEVGIHKIPQSVTPLQWTIEEPLATNEGDVVTFSWVRMIGNLCARTISLSIPCAGYHDIHYSDRYRSTSYPPSIFIHSAPTCNNMRKAAPIEIISAVYDWTVEKAMMTLGMMIFKCSDLQRIRAELSLRLFIWPVNENLVCAASRTEMHRYNCPPWESSPHYTNHNQQRFHRVILRSRMSKV